MNNRFIITENDRQGIMSGTKIVVDTVTGVQYLYVRDNYGGGLTVLVDENGLPLIDERLTQKHA